MHRRVMLGQDHVGAALQDLKLAGHGAGCPAQVGRGDHVEHGRRRGGDLDAERAEWADPPAPPSIDRHLAAHHQVVTRADQAACRGHRRCPTSDHARQPTDCAAVRAPRHASRQPRLRNWRRQLTAQPPDEHPGSGT